MSTPEPEITCTVGECDKPAALRVEVYRKASDPTPAEVRYACGPLCLRLARQSASEFVTVATSLEK